KILFINTFSIDGKKCRAYKFSGRHQLFLHGFIHSKSRGKNSGAAIWNSAIFQKALDAPVFSISAMQAQESKINMVLQFGRSNNFSQAPQHFKRQVRASLRNRFSINLE